MTINLRWLVRPRWVACLFGFHVTKLITIDREGAIACTRCGYTQERWPLIRPEEHHRQQRMHDRVMADRDARAARMGLRLVRREKRA